MNSINSFIYKRFNLSLFFFLISGLYGFLMRWQRIADILSYNYIDVLQAHSHVTFLGWGFLAAITLITAAYLSDIEQVNKLLTYSFWVMSVSIIGMLLSFPLQGYKFFSIGFLTLFLLASYVYLYELYINIRKSKEQSIKFIKAGIFYYFLSSLGIWGLSIITVKIGRGDLYQNVINFYTHFLYNGFFVLSLFGLLFTFIERQKRLISEKSIRVFYYLTTIAVIPAFALSLLWRDVPNYIVLFGFIGAIIQLVSLAYLWRISVQILRKEILSIYYVRFLFISIIVAYMLKIMMQFVSAFPTITKIALQYKPYFVIGYIHLFTLAFMSLFLIVLYELLLKRTISRWGMILFVLGIISSELILFSQGLLVYTKQKTINNFNEILLIASGLMVLGLMLIFVNIFIKKEIKKLAH